MGLVGREAGPAGMPSLALLPYRHEPADRRDSVSRGSRRVSLLPVARSSKAYGMALARSTLTNIRWRPERLETEHLLLRGYELSDCEGIFAYASDPAVAAYMAWDRHQSIEDTRRFLNTFVAANYRARELDYAICERGSSLRVIGGLGAYWRSRSHGVMELGYVLAKEHWGKGYIPEAAKRLMAYAFETTDVQRIYAPILAENTKSRRAAQKMGMTLDGTLRSSLMLRGRRWDEAVFSMLRAEVSPG